MKFRNHIFNMAKQDVKTIVFPESFKSDIIIDAVKYCVKKGLIKAILLGDESALFLRYNNIENENIQLLNPKTSELKNIFAKQILELRKEKGLTEKEAETLAEDPIFFGTMLVKNGYADGMVSGTESSSVTTFRPALQLIKGTKKDQLISTSMLYVGKNRLLKNRPVLVSDCAMIENPSVEELVKIAENAVNFWKMLFIEEPKVAFLSYSSKGSNESDSISKMRKSAEEFKKIYPYVISDGELQLDCALIPSSQAKKCKDSEIKGDANILIAPDIDAGNMLGKSMHYVGGLTGIGPISQGFVKPVNDATRSCTFDELVLLIAVTAVQAQI